MHCKKTNRKFGARLATIAMLSVAIIGFDVHAESNDARQKLGKVENEIAASLVPGTRYDNIVNIGCGWASGVNFASSYDWPAVLQAVFADPGNVYNILTEAPSFTPYENRYALLVEAALEQRDGHEIQFFDVAKTGHTSPYGKFEIDELDAIIDEVFGGQLTGNTLVLYEFGPPDFLRLVSTLFDRDPTLNPIAASMPNGDPFPPGAAAFGDSYWQARFDAELGGDPTTPARVVERYLGHFRPTVSGATPYVDETDVLGPPFSNTLTIADRFFTSYAQDYDRFVGNAGSRYGEKVDVIVIGNENPYEGGENFRQYTNSVLQNFNAIFPCTLFPTLFGCRPDTVETNLGIDLDYVHPFADALEEFAADYTERMLEQANEKGVSMINVYELFAGHHSRFDDPTSPHYVEADPTYWAYMAEINALGHEVVADVVLHILNTGKKTYRRKHSDNFRDRALENEFEGVYGY